MAGENLDLSSDAPSSDGGQRKRPYVGIYFACCGVYAQISLNRAKRPTLGIAPAASSGSRSRSAPVALTLDSSRRTRSANRRIKRPIY